MSLTIPKSYLYQFLFVLCISIPYLNNYELTFAVWLISFLITLKKIYSFNILRIVSCFVAILTIAFIVMFYYDYKIYFIIRDITYMLKPIIGLLLGYQLCKNNFNKAFQTLVYTGFFIACIHLWVLFSAVIFNNARTVNDLRFYGGYFSDFEVYALIILLFHQKFELGIAKKKLKYITIIVGISSFMYLARTNFIQFVILFVAMKGYFKINKTSLTVLASIIIFTIVGYSAILYSNPRRNGPGIEALLYKIKIAPIEPFKTKINADDWKDFNDNYRSYENIHTVQQLTRRGTPTMLFGKGLGSQIDLKREVWLGDMMLRYISILHNGFMTVFLKSGLLGILIYLYSIFLMFKQRASKDPIVKNINLLLVGTGIFLVFSNWVFMGLYNLSDSKSIIIGFIICFKEIAEKNQKGILNF